MCVIGETVDLGDNKKYLFNQQHRAHVNCHKSLWIISLNDELNCFKLSCNNNWINDCCGWGLHILDGQVCCLGKSILDINLKIAKFVDKNFSGTWHGYPADYVNNIQDRPATSVLTDWVHKKYIDKTGMARILRGMRGGI